MAVDMSEFLGDKWPLLSVAILAALAALLVQPLFGRYTLSNIPCVGLEVGDEEKRRLAYLAGAKRLYQAGYQTFKHGVFRITTSRTMPIIVVHPMFLNELKKLPDDVLSMEAAVDDAMEAKYTGIETHVPLIPYTIKTQLTPALVRLNPSIADEVKEALRLELPPSNDWTELNIHHKLLRIVARVSGRVFIGPELCHQEKYLDASINYTMDVMAAQKAVQQMRPWLRPFIASRLSQVRRLNQRIAEADEFLRPVVNLRKTLANNPGYEKPDDMLQWLMDGQAKFGQKNDEEFAKIQLGISFAAIHTTTLTATNAFYNLAAMPELVSELRNEAMTVLAETGGVFTSVALQNMKKLDSFLKETLRYHPVTFASFQRKVLKSFTLSNKQVLPAGATIECPAYAINYDNEIFPNAAEFDPLRFYKLRQKVSENGVVGSKATEASAQNQFVSVSQNSLTFGYGRHACPGRFFAANEIKMIVANTVLQYDIKMADGSKGRYPNVEFAHMSIPDPSKTLMLKRIT